MTAATAPIFFIVALALAPLLMASKQTTPTEDFSDLAASKPQVAPPELPPAPQAPRPSAKDDDLSDLGAVPANPIPAPKPAPRPLPATGPFHRYWTRSEGEVTAPLRIITAAGSPNYFIKVVDLRGAPIITTFVRSGQIMNTEIPLGSYRLRVASGKEWYGEHKLFGPDTAYSRAQDQLDFTIEGDRAQGNVITLIKQVGGNLKIVDIRPEDF